jgi:hypothetical protein
MKFLGWLLRPMQPGSQPLWIWLALGIVAISWAVVLTVQGNIWLGAAIMIGWLGYRLPAEFWVRRRR